MDHGGEVEDYRRAPLLHSEAGKDKGQAAAPAPAPAPGGSLGRRVYEESKQLWVIVGPAIFTRITNYSMNVIMQAFAGHLGDLELASVSFACTVLVGFNYGIMVRYTTLHSLLSSYRRPAAPLVAVVADARHGMACTSSSAWRAPWRPCAGRRSARRNTT
jgi:MATE family multidrug resistance protein